MGSDGSALARSCRHQSAVLVPLEGALQLHVVQVPLVVGAVVELRDSGPLQGLQCLVQRLISLDPNVRLNVEPDIQLWRQRIGELVQHADLIKVSDEDLAQLYPGQAPEELIQGWLQEHAQLVFLTRGSQGATVFSARHGSWSVASPQVQVADTVGAGDTFQAALIAWLTEQGLDSPQGLGQLTPAQIDSLLRFAVQAAALTCTRTGPDLPYRHQLQPL